MRSYNYYNPVNIEFGVGKEEKIGKILKADGHKKVLFVYGKSSIKKTGLYDKICSNLKKSGIDFIEHGEVSSNPTLSHAREGLKKIKNATAILAVGGGSVIDESKAIAAAFASKCDIWDLYSGKKATDALPIYVVLTISATGSEMNCGTVLTNEETEEKLSFKSPFVFPKVSIINPALTFTLPENYLIYSAVDTIAHVIEGYFTSSAHPIIISRFCENIIKTTIETTEKLLKNPQDLDARAEFAQCSTWALNGLASIGIGEYSFPNHMIEHSLSAIYNVPHGAGLAVVTSAWMKWFYKTNKGVQFERFAKEIFGKNSAEEGIEAYEKWLKKIKAPIRLKDLDINKNEISKIVENLQKVTPKWEMDHIYTKSVIEEILNLMV